MAEQAQVEVNQKKHSQKRSLADRLALFPTDNNSWRPGLKDLAGRLSVTIKDCTIDGPNGSQLATLLLAKPESKYVYLVSHGNGGNLGFRLHMAADLIATGQSVFLYDYEGYGESSGTARLVNLIPDGLAAYDYLTGKLGYKPEQIILYGESIGSGPTTAIMQKRKCRGVILQSGFTSLIAAGKNTFVPLKVLPTAFLPAPHFNNLEAVKKDHPPLLLIHGDQDEILPVQYSRLMFAQASQPKYYFEVKGAGHNDIERVDKAGFLQAITNFLQTLN